MSTAGLGGAAAPLLALLGSLSSAVNGLKIQLAHLESKVDATQGQVQSLGRRSPTYEPEAKGPAHAGFPAPLATRNQMGTLANRMVVPEPEAGGTAKEALSSPWREMALEIDDEDDASVREAKTALRQRLAEQAAKRAASQAGKSSVRKDGLACVESMEGLMRGVGGVATSLEGTMLALLHRLSVDHPTRYASAKAFQKTGIRDRSRAYDVIRTEVLGVGKSIYDSVALERAAEEVSLLYVDIFAPPKANREALKAVIKPDEDFLMQLSGSAERFGLLHMRAKQVSQLGGYASKGSQGDGDGDGGGGSGPKKK